MFCPHYNNPARKFKGLEGPGRCHAMGMSLCLLDCGLPCEIAEQISNQGEKDGKPRRNKIRKEGKLKCQT